MVSRPGWPFRIPGLIFQARVPVVEIGIDMQSEPSYADLQDALRRADANAGAAEAHGILCGMLCAEQGADRAAWIAEVLGEQPAGNLSAQEAAALLDAVLNATLQQMGDGMLGLRLLLPADEEPLPKRVRALGTWCEGFLLGISRAKRQGAEPSEEVRELLVDLVEITKVDSGELGEGQDDEQSYAEVVEYVRMGVLMAFEQSREAQPPPAH